MLTRQNATAAHPRVSTEGVRMSFKGKLWFLLIIIAIGVLIGMNNPQPTP
jgi:hypothetical protein